MKVGLHKPKFEVRTDSNRNHLVCTKWYTFVRTARTFVHIGTRVDIFETQRDGQSAFISAELRFASWQRNEQAPHNNVSVSKLDGSICISTAARIPTWLYRPDLRAKPCGHASYLMLCFRNLL